MTLQEQYNLIKEGKGHKDVFLKHVKSQFPQYIPNHLGFDLTVQILKEKSILNENLVDIQNIDIDGFGNRNKENWENEYEKFLTEAKKKQEKAVKADLKKTDKSVEDILDNDYDNKDMKNADNVIFDQYMRGIYTEMSSDSELTLDEAKKIVLKNLTKDPIWYTKNSAFGIKDIGYTDQLPGTEVSKKDPKFDTLAKDKTKSNVKDNLGKKEGAKGDPKNVKKQTFSTKKPRGVKAAPSLSKEKVIKLKEGMGLDSLLEDETFESRLKEMVSKVLDEGPLEDADAKLAKDQANKEAEAANIEKQRADNKAKIANANKNI